MCQVPLVRGRCTPPHLLFLAPSLLFLLDLSIHVLVTPFPPMRKIVSTGERLSSHWLILTRPTVSKHCIRPQQSLAPKPSECRGQLSSLAAIPRQRNGSQPCKRRLSHKRDSIQEFNTTSKLPGIDVGAPDTIESPIQEEVDLPTWTSPEEERAYAEDFFRAIQNGQPDEVMRVLTDPRSAGLVGSLPQTIFTEALHRLSPAHFVEPFRNLHRPLHAWSVLKNGIKRLEAIFDDFVRNLSTIARYRTAGGHVLQLDEYRHFLDCARAMGNGPFARQLWESMSKERIVPDAICYNHYMEALVWDHCYTGMETNRLRALPFHYKKRKRAEPDIGWQGFGTAGRSVRREVMSIFKKMLNDGHLADERAYINVLLASSRVGHGPGIRHVLKMVWNIDVDALKEQHNNPEIPAPTSYDFWSGLYPTENLLFAVAHALGTNNDIAGAVQTVEFISNSYNIPIPERVWHELFERAYVLCRQRTTKTVREQQANDIGRVSLDLVRSLFDTMTSAPYNLKPTVQILRFMINISIDSYSLEDCKLYLDAAYKIIQESRVKQEEARTVVLRCLQPALEAAEAQYEQGINPDPSLFQSPHLAEAIQAYDMVRLQVYQETYLLKRILWIVIRMPHWGDLSETEWYHQERPKMQEEWRDFLPAQKQIHYDENIVTIHGRTVFGDRHWYSDEEIPIRRRTEGKELFSPAEQPTPHEMCHWDDISARYPFLDTTMAPINRLFSFEMPDTPEFQEALDKLRNTWVEYPDDHRLSTKNNPTAGFYGRLAALGMLKPTERDIYLLDDVSWV